MKKFYILYDGDMAIHGLYKLDESEIALLNDVFEKIDFDGYFGWSIVELDKNDYYETVKKGE